MTATAKITLPYRLEYASDQVDMILTPEPGDPVAKIARIVRKSDGRLWCTYHSADWCEHIKTLINDHADWQLLVAVDTERVGQKVTIPLVPKYNIYAVVKFDSWDIDTQTGQVALLTIPDTSGWATLGYISAGEGRKVLREMIYDWFRGCVDYENFKCRVTAHSYNDEVELQKHLQTPTAALAEQWTMWQKGACLSCNDSMASFDDVVPF